MNSQTDQKVPSYPWYDDHVKDLCRNHIDSRGEHGDKSKLYATPQEIYSYLDQHVWKQEEAKKAASIIAYNCLHGIKSNAMFVGPTASGKSYTWRCLKEIFWDRIEIVDGSNLTLDGWKGSTKWKYLLRSPIFRSGDNAILVIDEADKMLAPKYSHEENISQSVQAEGLTLMEGTCVDVKDGSVIPSPPWPCRTGWTSRQSPVCWGTTTRASPCAPTPTPPARCRIRRRKPWAALCPK